MEKIKKQIIDLLNENSIKVHSAGSCGELGDSFKALDSDSFLDIASEIYDKLIKELQHHKDSTIGLFATDKEPNKIFEIVINSISGNGEPIMSAVDYEYYKNIFDTELQKLMFKIK